MKHVAVVLVVAGVGLGWGAGASAQHKVDVSVTNCVITPDPESLPVKAKNVNIFWELDASSSLFYRFTADGVTLKTPSAEFEQPELQANDKKFKLHDKNSLKGTHTYPYKIKVQRLVFFQWTDCPPLDPTIVNEG